MSARPALLAASVVLAVLAGGCASSVCTRVRGEHDAFVRRAAEPGPHLALAVPYATISQSLQRQFSAARPVTIPLPDLGPIDLGSLAVSLRGVGFREAPAGSLGARVSVALASGGRQVTALDLDVVVTPQLDPKEGSVRVRLRPQDLAQVRPSLPPAERQRFAEFILGMVPAAARALVGRDQVERLADTFLRELVGGRWPQIRDHLFQGTDDLVDVEIDLPELPLTKLELRSGAVDLELWAHASLPAAALSPGPARPAGADARLVALRLSGAAAAALANRAMAQGQIPARYDREGAPNPSGEFLAGVYWKAGPRPLKVHAWSLSGTCARLTFGGTPAVSGRGAELDVQVPDGTLEEVAGSLKARVGVWFSGLGRQTFALSETVAGATELELGGATYQARVVAGSVAGADLVFTLALAEAPRGPTPRR